MERAMKCIFTPIFHLALRPFPKSSTLSYRVQIFFFFPFSNLRAAPRFRKSMWGGIPDISIRNTTLHSHSSAKQFLLPRVSRVASPALSRRLAGMMLSAAKRHRSFPWPRVSRSFFWRKFVRLQKSWSGAFWFWWRVTAYMLVTQW